MGAYDNPAMIVDRQSGQYINQALKDIGNTFNAYGQIMGKRRIAKQEKEDQKAEQNNIIRKNSILESSKLKATALFNINKANPVNIKTLTDDVDMMFDRYSNSLQRFKTSQYNDGYAGSEEERLDILNISATQNFSTNAESLFKNSGELMTEYKELYKKYGEGGGINPYDMDPMWQVFMNTSEGKYGDGQVEWTSVLDPETQTVDFSYSVTGKAVQKQNAINWYNSLTPEFKKQLGLDNESSVNSAEKFAEMFSGVGLNLKDVDFPADVFETGFAMQNDQGGISFSNESSFSMNRLKDIMEDVDGNPYSYGGLFSVIPDTIENLTTSANESQVTINGKINPKYFENVTPVEKTFYKGDTQYKASVTIPNLEEIDLWATNSARSQVNLFEEMAGGVGNFNAIIRQHAKPVMNGDDFVYDADGNQMFSYKQFQESPNEENDYMWSKPEAINIPLLDEETIYNSESGTAIWKEQPKKASIDFIQELAKRQGGYYSVPTQNETPTGKVKSSSRGQTTLPPQFFIDLSDEIINDNTVNYSNPESVVEFFNNKRLDKTKAKTGSGAIQEIQLQIDKYMTDGEPSKGLSKDQKKDLASLQANASQLDPNAVYIKWGGKGKYEPVEIGSAGILANSVRASFTGDAEQKNFDIAYTRQQQAKINDFTFEAWYENTFGIEPSKMDKNNSTSIAGYKEALDKLKAKLKR